MGWKAVSRLALLTLAWLALPLALPAQDRPATPPIAADHWVYDALDRLHAAGLLDGLWLVGDRPRSEGAIEAALRAAAARGSQQRAPLASFARAALDRFLEEFPSPRPASPAPTPPPAAAAAADSTPVTAPDSAPRRTYPGRRQAALGARIASGGHDDGQAGALGGQIALPLGRHLAFLFQPELRAGSPHGLAYRQQRLILTGKLGPAWVFAGRERSRLGPATSGGLLLSGTTPFDGLSIGLDSPIRLPGIARHLGPFLATLLVTRIPADSLGAGEFLAAARVAFAPHPRIQLGLNRSALVLAQVDGRNIGLADLLYIAVGKHTDADFENQLASIDLRARVDLRGWPVVVYIELGTEDSAGAFTEDPGLILGLFLPILPGLPAVSLRYEYTAFGPDAFFCVSCDGRARSWYRHRTRSGHRAVYADADGVPFGHPLGGYGHEHLLQARVWPAAARLRLAASLRARNREPLNLLFEQHPGPSRAAALEAAYRLNPHLDLEADAAGEWGSAGWSEHLLWLALRAFF